MDDADASMALHNMAKYLSRYYGKKAVILHGFAFDGKTVLIG